MSTGDRRADILAAAFRCFARDGYERTRTAQICRAAAVSSGTFFHYFPTKVSVLVAVLQSGFDETRVVLEELRDLADRDPQASVRRWQEHVLAEAADPDLAGFVSALGTAPHDERVTAVLKAESALTHDVLTHIVSAGQRVGAFRTDRAADRLAAWLAMVAQGVLVSAVDDGAFSAQPLRQEFADVVTRVLAPI